MNNINDKEAFAKRLNMILDEANYAPNNQGRQVELGKDFNLSQKGAGKWLNAESIPRHDKILAISEKFGVSPLWLEYGKGNRYNEQMSNSQDKKFDRKQFIGKGINTIYIIPPIKAIMIKPNQRHSKHTQEILKDCDTIEGISHNLDCYAFDITSHDMTSPANSGISFPQGFKALIDYSRSTPAPGEFVLVEITETKEIKLKQYQLDGNAPYLHSLNPNFPPIFDKFKVLATCYGITQII